MLTRFKKKKKKCANPFSSNGQVETTLTYDNVQEISLLNLQLIIIIIIIITMEIFKAPDTLPCGSKR